MKRQRELDDLDDGDFSPRLQAQIEYLEHSNEQAERTQARLRHRNRIRRALEDASQSRRLRDEIDYLR